MPLPPRRVTPAYAPGSSLIGGDMLMMRPKEFACMCGRQWCVIAKVPRTLMDVMRSNFDIGVSVMSCHLGFGRIRLRNSGAESLSESGMRWMSGLVQSNNDRALLPPQRAGVVDQDIDAPKGRGHSVDAGLFTGAVTSLFTFPV